MADDPKRSVVRIALEGTERAAIYPLEAVRVADDPQLTRWIDKVSKALNEKFSEKAPTAERAVTREDLFKMGLISLRDGGGQFRRYRGDGPRDMAWIGGDPNASGPSVISTIQGPPGPPGPPAPTPAPPPAATTPVNLQATGGLTSIYLTWNAQDFAVVAYVEVFAHSANDRAAAVKIGNAYTNVYVDPIGATGVTRWYWIRSVGFGDANVSGFNDVGGTAAATGKIGTTDLSDLIITAGKLADGAVGSNQLAAGAITAAKFAAGLEPVVVLTALPNPAGYTGPRTVFLTTDQKLYRYTGSAWTAAVPFGDVSGVAITSTHITDGAITTPKLAANAVTANEIAANAITAGKIAAGAVTANAIAANAIAVGTAAIQNGAIVNAMIGNAEIDNAKIANLDAGKITTGFLNAGRIQVGSIDSRIASITDAQIQSLSAGKVVASYLSAITANLGVVGAGQITLDAYAGGWSILRSYNKWWGDGVNGFVFAGYNPTGSNFIDLRAGPNVFRMAYGPSVVGGGGHYTEINWNGRFIVDSDGNLTCTNAYVRGNVEATTVKADAVGVVSTLNLAGDSVVVPRTTSCGFAQVGGNVSIIIMSLVVNPGNGSVTHIITIDPISYYDGSTSYNYGFTLRLYRGGTIVKDWPVGVGLYRDPNAQDPVTLMLTDPTPGAANHTYSLHVIRANSFDSNAGVRYGNWTALGVKNTGA